MIGRDIARQINEPSTRWGFSAQVNSRRIYAMVTTQKNIQLVWSETEDVMRRLFEIWDRFGTEEVRMGNVADMTEKVRPSQHSQDPVPVLNTHRPK